MTPPLRLAAVRRALLVLVAALTAVLLSSAPAMAHAALLQTTPFDTERVEPDTVPEAVTLTFNEAIDAPPGGIRVFDASGARVDVDGEVPAADALDVVGRALEPLDEGAYLVTWRVVSADGHPLRGAFVFTVGDATALSDGFIAEIFGGGGGVVPKLSIVVTWLTYATVLLAAGALLARALGGVKDDERIVRVGAIAALALSVIAVPLQAMAVSGDGIAAAVDGAQLGAVLTASVGMAALVRIVGLVGVLTMRGTPQTVAGVVALLSFLIDGHTRTVEPAWLLFSADTIHLLAAAVWFGGLIVLLRQLHARRLADDPVGGAQLVASWSRLALWTVVAVSIAGSALSFALVRGPVALTTTTYGALLLIKLALAAVVIALGAYNHRMLVPAIARAVVPAGEGSDGGETSPPMIARTEAGWLRLRSTVRVEVIVLVLVMAVTGVLSSQRPASEAVGIGGIFDGTQAVSEDLDLQVVVDPNLAGQNSIHLYLLDSTGRLYAEVDGISMSLSLPAEDIGPIEREPIVTGPGHWTLNGGELALAGTWEITVDIRIDRFTQTSLTYTTVVGSG